MKSTELWRQYQEYTEEVSKKLSVLGFGAIAICWVFRSSDFTFPCSIRWALVFAIAYFFFDVIQYFGSAITYRLWIRSQEKKLHAEGKPIIGEMPKPSWLDYVAFSTWALKLCVLLISYAFIGIHILQF